MSTEAAFKEQERILFPLQAAIISGDAFGCSRGGDNALLRSANFFNPGS